MGFKDRIAKFFKKDKEIKVAEKGKGWTHDDPTGLVDTDCSGVRNLQAALTMDQALMSRYVDYENMDDYPELTAGLDIYADDTTITDNLRNKTIWAESKDKILRDIIDDLLHRRIRIEEDIWLIMRTLCKYGNALSEIVTT